MQLQMFDPRITPTATAEMLADGDLNEAINSMRCGVVRPWPYVERLCKVDGALVWAVDDEGELATRRDGAEVLGSDVDVRLWTVTPAFDGTGGTEVSGGGYAAAVVTFNATAAGTGGLIECVANFQRQRWAFWRPLSEPEP